MTQPILYSAWFCPFAQRSWIALIYKGIDFEYKEQDPYNKSPEWLAINPRGLVPALVIGSEVVIESGIINEYIDEAWPQKDTQLLPPLSQPFERSQARLWADFVNRKMIPPFYQLLQRQEKSEQDAAAGDLLAALKTFAEGMQSQGPFFMGNSLGIVDITFVPWSLRFFILKKYRGFEVPTEGAEWHRFRCWRDACEQHPSVMETLQKINLDNLCATYERYAKNQAESLVAKAINANKPLP